MTTHKLPKDKWGKTYADILIELLGQELADCPHVEWQSEGMEMPSGLEPVYWQTLTKQERVLGFWLEWDSRKTAPDGSQGYYSVRRDIHEHQPDPRNPNYILARKDLGLPLTGEQLQILQKLGEEYKIR